MIEKCICGSGSQSTGSGNYVEAYYKNNEIIYATCEHGYVIVDKRNSADGSILFDTCETPIYRIQ